MQKKSYISNRVHISYSDLINACQLYAIISLLHGVYLKFYIFKLKLTLIMLCTCAD